MNADDDFTDTRWLDTAVTYAYPMLNLYLGWTKERVRTVINNSYYITPELVKEVAAMKQRTYGWKLWRNGWVDVSKEVFRGKLISSSFVGYIAQHVKVYSNELDPEKYKPDPKLKDGDTNYMKEIATQQGTAMEPETMKESALVTYHDVAIRLSKLGFAGHLLLMSSLEVGLQLSPRFRHMAASPDIIERWFDPNTDTYWITGGEMKSLTQEGANVRAIIKHEYFDQITHTMKLLDLNEYSFIVHASGERGFSTEVYAFNNKYWDRQLPIFDEWYWSEYYVALVFETFGVFQRPENERNQPLDEWCLKHSVIDQKLTKMYEH